MFFIPWLLMLFLQFKRLLSVLSLSSKIWPVKDEFMKFAADIFAKIVRILECDSSVHVTAEKQSVWVTLQNCKLCHYLYPFVCM